MNFLTTKETASLVRRPESTLRRWRSAGKGPPCYKLEGQWAYVEDEERIDQAEHRTEGKTL